MAYMILSKVSGGYMRVSHQVYSSIEEVNQSLSAMVGMVGRTIVVVSHHQENLHEGVGNDTGYVLPIDVFGVVYKDEKLAISQPLVGQSRKFILVD